VGDAELGCDDELVPMPCGGFAQEGLVVAGVDADRPAVDIGGIEERDAEIDCPVHHPDGILV